MLNSTGASLWHHVAMNVTKVHITPTLRRGTANHLTTSSAFGINIHSSIQSHFQARSLSVRALRSAKNKNVLTRASKALLAHQHQRSQPFAPIDASEFNQMYSSGPNLQDINGIKTKTAPTIAPIAWLDRMPKSIQPYLFLTRIDKPIGTWLLFWPCGKYPLSSIE
ncbi:hypothetical protein BCR41DRAFT_232378 [Lobosporangium transversale]|uniref:Uncharacterized protein n=1 Tax=Lobosporangium transversale TaxID=64571 RepID=A0A1Y2G5X1_9FUNG|nr:hypothetical protein BCR41DRAFT_232378 [Lobosporangium transversale]ORY96073.1 hypothetical protein BCR41DRAFT_232378 [Lobosporangium transversale]|eukprot:XP_021875500.1 hypothetical protein BCR41DRAFT_232378 [Lobosporangium transversale]